MAGVSVPRIGKPFTSLSRLARTPLCGVWTHTIFGEVDKAEVVELGKMIEAYVFLIGRTELNGFVEVNDSSMVGGLDGCKESGDVTLILEVFRITGW